MPNDHTLRTYDSILGLLSSEENPTPLVRLNKVTPFEHTQVYAKLEWYNPFGAVKDRIAANMITDAEARGALGAGKSLVEATSGNTGLGLMIPDFRDELAPVGLPLFVTDSHQIISAAENRAMSHGHERITRHRSLPSLKRLAVDQIK